MFRFCGPGCDSMSPSSNRLGAGVCDEIGRLVTVSERCELLNLSGLGHTKAFA
jgi:hypothetical protein